MVDFSRQCYFKVVSLAFTVCVWSTVGFFKKEKNPRTQPLVVTLKRRVSMNRERKRAAITKLPHLSVGGSSCVCVRTCERVFLCANRQQAEAAGLGEMALVHFGVETLYLGHLCVRRIFCVPSSSPSSSSLSAHNPWPSVSSPVPFAPPFLTHLYREDKLEHSGFGKKKGWIKKQKCLSTTFFGRVWFIFEVLLMSFVCVHAWEATCL